MPGANDMDLLRDYAGHGSETAFAGLVQRHINLVYSVALRHVGIAAHAEEITQAVFVILARKAGKLRPDTVLEGWLFETTRLTALSFLRGERRRQFREQEAYMESILNEPPAGDAVWRQLAPLLDEAMSRLGRKDRDAVILRFFKEKSVREVATALQTSESAAQRRVLRALEKLRNFFTRRGVSSTTAIIAGVLSTNSIQAAPVALAKSVTTLALAKGAAASTSTLTLIHGALKLMAWTKAKITAAVAVGAVLAAGTTIVAIKSVHAAAAGGRPARAAELFQTFITEQKSVAIAAAAAEGKQLPPEYEEFFAAAAKGDWPSMQSRWADVQNHPPLTDASVQAIRETYFAFDMFSRWDEKYAMLYAHGILGSIPSGSIYFSGVSMGGEVVPAFEESQTNGNPCFTFSLFQLCDPGYRSYLRSLFGNGIYAPSEADAQKCFQEYAPDAWQRFQQNQLQRKDLQRIDVLIAKVVFDRNPDREFYCEQGMPDNDWMYPHLEPHGLILKLNREPLAALSDETVAADHDFWAKLVQPMIGDWLKDETPVKDLAGWTEHVRLRHDFNGFTGDRSFIENRGGEQIIFSNLRTYVGGVYAWRANHAASAAEKERMSREADFAFRQALALWPCSPASNSAVLQYISLLRQEGRISDANLIRDMALHCAKKLNP